MWRGWTRHVSEPRLLDAWLAEQAGDSTDPPVAEHLADCRVCRSRHAELVGMMDELRSAADHEVAAAFPPGRLRTQQSAIAARLELLGQAARVISFPGQSGGSGVRRHASTWTPSRATAGWMAAVAAGLIIGLGAGMLYDGRTIAPQTSTISLRTIETPAAPADAPEAIDDDASLMSALEAVRERPRTQELIAFEAFTPRARETSYRTQ